MYSAGDPLWCSYLEGERGRKRRIDEVGLFDDAQTVIILAFVHGRFHSIRTKKEIRVFFKWIDDGVDSKKENETDSLFSAILLSFMTHVDQ